MIYTAGVEQIMYFIKQSKSVFSIAIHWNKQDRMYTVTEQP